ncbi:MAG: nucleotide exchange factor GrpE [Bryobacteraceae bacterium]|nr:nucleotide exchange factor GrpE [Bryobacterales bacterium]NUN02473.1 nucleotide exchange factor GrpE [Bryobacteraceae bacterium]
MAIENKPIVDDPVDSGPSALPEPPAEAEPVEEALLALVSERDRLAGEKAELQDQLLRLRAEFDNFRKREERERMEFAEFAAMEAIKPLLPVLDDFERALKADSRDSEYAKGVELIYQGLLDTLKKLGVEPIVAEGGPFDPNLHHAVETIKTGDFEDHTVVSEYQRGYNFKGRLLRPAMVRVAVRP